MKSSGKSFSWTCHFLPPTFAARDDPGLQWRSKPHRGLAARPLPMWPAPNFYSFGNLQPPSLKPMADPGHATLPNVPIRTALPFRFGPQPAQRWAESARWLQGVRIDLTPKNLIDPGIKVIAGQDSNFWTRVDVNRELRSKGDL